MNTQSPFTVLKKENSVLSRSAKSSSGIFYFWLKEDDYGVYVDICDNKKKSIFPDVNKYKGALYDALHLYNQLRSNIFWQLDWGRDQSQLYLMDHPDLLDLLLDCGNLLLPSGDSVKDIEELSEYTLTLKAYEKSEVLSWKICFNTSRRKDLCNFRFLTSSLIMSGKNLYKIKSLPNYQQLDLFNCTLDDNETERLLSLFLSTFSSAGISYFDFQVEMHGRIKSEPALVLEKVDSLGSLFLNVAASSPEIDIDFFNSYELTQIVSINRDKKVVKVTDVIPIDTLEASDKIERILKRYQDKKNPELSYSRVENLFILQSQLALTFLESELYHLLTDFVLIGSEELKKFNIKTVKPRLKLKVSSGIDFLEGQGGLSIENEEFDLSDFLKTYEEKKYILLSDGTRAIVEHGFIKRLKRLLKPDKEGNLRISFFDLPLVAELIDEKTASQGFIEGRKILEGFNSIKGTPPLVTKMKVTLRDYQKKGFAWLNYLKENKLGGCLADDMGLGKTVQSIALLATIYPKEKLSSLIVMPTSLLVNWQREVEKFAPKISSVIYHGADRDLSSALKKNLIFTTYAMVRNDIDKLREQNFYYIILDESQKIKNIQSKISKAVMLLNSSRRLALSGTPVENNIGELYSLYRFLNPAMFGSLKNFQDDYHNPITKQGDEEAMGDLKKKIYPFLLRRLKTDVLKELPDKTEQIIYVDMTPEQAKLYEKRRKFYHEAIKMQIKSEGFDKARFFLFQAMNELRQLASVPENKSEGSIRSPKREVLGEYLSEVIANGHKVLVFANYLEALNIMGEELSSQNIEYLTMTGSTRKRDVLVDSFQNDDKYRVLLMTLKTGGVGLNLTAADYVFIFDPWWNVAAENQAIDRVHRIGQKNSVFSYKLITKDTIEEKILQLQQQKTELVNALIESDGDSVKSISEEDIDFIFSDSRIQE